MTPEKLRQKRWARELKRRVKRKRTCREMNYYKRYPDRKPETKKVRQRLKQIQDNLRGKEKNIETRKIEKRPGVFKRIFTKIKSIIKK